MVTVSPRSDFGFQLSDAELLQLISQGRGCVQTRVPGVTRCVTNSKDCSAAAFGERIRVRRGAGNGVGVCRGSGLRGVRGESTAGSGEVGVGALIETNLSLK